MRSYKYRRLLCKVDVNLLAQCQPIMQLMPGCWTSLTLQALPLPLTVTLSTTTESSEAMSIWQCRFPMLGTLTVTPSPPGL